MKKGQRNDTPYLTYSPIENFINRTSVVNTDIKTVPKK